MSEIAVAPAVVPEIVEPSTQSVPEIGTAEDFLACVKLGVALAAPCSAALVFDWPGQARVACALGAAAIGAGLPIRGADDYSVLWKRWPWLAKSYGSETVAHFVYFRSDMSWSMHGQDGRVSAAEAGVAFARRHGFV